jgi:hypothetical protein
MREKTPKSEQCGMNMTILSNLIYFTQHIALSTCIEKEANEENEFGEVNK